MGFGGTLHGTYLPTTYLPNNPTINLPNRTYPSYSSSHLLACLLPDCLLPDCFLSARRYCPPVLLPSCRQCDPEAASIVFGSGFHITMVPLEVTGAEGRGGEGR